MDTPNQLLLVDNGTDKSPLLLPEGRFNLVCTCSSWGGRTVTVQRSADNTNWFDVPGNAFTADGFGDGLHGNVLIQAISTSDLTGVTIRLCKGGE